METDIIINPSNRKGLTIDLVGNCKLFVPQGTIIKVRDTYAICIPSKHLQLDCSRCVGRYSVGHTLGVCPTLMCRKKDREDKTEVFFEVIDHD